MRSRKQGAVGALAVLSGLVCTPAIDPRTRRRHDLVEVIPAGPDAAREAERRVPGS